jgi:hypothetical protein
MAALSTLGINAGTALFVVASAEPFGGAVAGIGDLEQLRRLADEAGGVSARV